MLKAEQLVSKDWGEFGNNISGVAKNKISILRALAKGCEILVCDEMFANLDDESKQDINQFLLNSNDLTIITVTHDVSLQNLKMYVQVIVLKNGHIKDIVDQNKLDNNKKDFLWD